MSIPVQTIQTEDFAMDYFRFGTGERALVILPGLSVQSVMGADASMEIAQALDERKDFRLYMYTGYGHAAFDTAPDYRQRLAGFFSA